MSYWFFYFVASTHDQHVFSFYPDHRPCHGFEEALARYKEIVPHLKLSGLMTRVHHFAQCLCTLLKNAFDDNMITIILDAFIQQHFMIMIMHE